MAAAVRLEDTGLADTAVDVQVHTEDGRSAGIVAVPPHTAHSGRSLAVPAGRMLGDREERTDGAVRGSLEGTDRLVCHNNCTVAEAGIENAPAGEAKAGHRLGLDVPI
jgi:hypothetical protein